MNRGFALLLGSASLLMFSLMVFFFDPSMIVENAYIKLGFWFISFFAPICMWIGLYLIKNDR